MQQTPNTIKEMRYYSKTYVQHLIREGLKDRELAFLGNNAPVRALSVKCLYDLERALKWTNWDKNKQNMYRSVAKLKKIPQFTFNPKKRSYETGIWFDKEFDSLVYEYDLFLDFDKDEDSSISDVLKEAKRLISYFDDYKIPYYVLFSGSKGFQVIIDGRYFSNFNIKNGVVIEHKLIAEKIKERFNLKFLDLRNNGVPNRLCKVPYSIVGENIALPLSKEQIENFDIHKVNKEIVMNEVTLIRRGTLERFEDLSFEEKIKNIEEFININLK